MDRQNKGLQSTNKEKYSAFCNYSPLRSLIQHKHFRFVIVFTAIHNLCFIWSAVAVLMLYFVYTTRCWNMNITKQIEIVYQKMKIKKKSIHAFEKSLLEIYTVLILSIYRNIEYTVHSIRMLRKIVTSCGKASNHPQCVLNIRL